MTEQSFTVPVQGGARPADVEPGLPSGRRYECVIGPCPWHYDAPPAPVVDEQFLADMFGSGSMALQAANQHAAKIAYNLEQHASTHTVTDFILEINAQRSLSLGLAGQLVEMSEALKIAMASRA